MYLMTSSLSYSKRLSLLYSWFHWSILKEKSRNLTSQLIGSFHSYSLPLLFTSLLSISPWDGKEQNQPSKPLNPWPPNLYSNLTSSNKPQSPGQRSGIRKGYTPPGKSSNESPILLYTNIRISLFPRPSLSIGGRYNETCESLIDELERGTSLSFPACTAGSNRSVYEKAFQRRNEERVKENENRRSYCIYSEVIC